MRWTPGQTSEDIEDRRSSSGGGGFGGFGGIHLGIGGTLLVLILSFVFHQNLFTLFTGAGPSDSVNSADRVSDTSQDGQVKFVSFVLDDVQHTWEQVLPKSGTPYRHAKLVLYRDEIESACGMAQSATGPFYCPGDEKVYLDLSFFDELKTRFGAPGEFAEAYVIAHEMGHHVQKLLGIEHRVAKLREENPRGQNPLSVRLELQADCFAGVWANRSQQEQGWRLEPGDIEAALNAAAQIGDDTLQRRARGTVVPESFTHGTSAERVNWFKRGFNSGQIDACDTFSAQPL